MTIDAAQRRRAITPSGFFALSFGSIVGSGWIVLLGEWLRTAAPAGAVLAIVCGAALMGLISLCYAELAVRLPAAGGEIHFALEILGPKAAFAAGWFIILFLIVVCVFEATAISLLLRALVPDIRGPALYAVFGESISLDMLVVGTAGALLIGAINLVGVRSSILFQRVVTYIFLLVMAGLVIAGFILGDPAHSRPWLETPGPGEWWTGALWIFASCAMFLNGFQAALYAIEDRRPGVTVLTVVKAMMIGIGCAALFYVLIILAATMAAPWQEFIDADLPAVAAFDRLWPGVAGPIVLGAAIISLLKTWNAVLGMAIRILVKQAEERFLPKSLACTNAVGAPARAIVLVTVITIAGATLGRAIIVPVVNMATIAITFTLALSLFMLLRLRQTSPPTAFAVPGGRPVVMVGLLGALTMAGFAFAEPVLRHRAGLPVEWLLMLVWLVAGIVIMVRPAVSTARGR